MEVHAHTHTARKKWTHYLFEFLMLFLAVFAGFLAENQREHYIEHRREKVYMRSIAEDIRQDISQLDSIIRIRSKMDIYMDSLLYLLNYADPKQRGNDIYYYARWIPRTYRFYTNDRTISQLKNAGNWRLIRNKEISDGLAAYDNFINTFTIYIQEREESQVLIWYQYVNRLFDNKVFEKMVSGLGFTRPKDNPQLMSYDKFQLNEFCNMVHFRKNGNSFFISNAEKLSREAKKTLALIESKYHLK